MGEVIQGQQGQAGHADGHAEGVEHDGQHRLGRWRHQTGDAYELMAAARSMPNARTIVRAGEQRAGRSGEQGRAPAIMPLRWG